MSTPPRTLVLLVSAQSEESRPLAAGLQLDGFQVDRAGSAGHARALARMQGPALVLIGSCWPERSP